FVRARAAADDPGLVDLSMNLPPPADGISLAALLRDTTAAVLQRTDPATLMAYHPGAGTVSQQTAAARWLAPALGDVSPDRVLLSAGAQTALAATLSAICTPGDVLAVEPLTYPGLKALAAQLGLQLAACPADDEGLRPEALERLVRGTRARALYVIPTMQNPTAVTLGPARRREIARIAEASDLWIIEDDPYSRLSDRPLPAIASLAPERTIHIATLSKCLSPGLRTAFVACPGGLVRRLEDSLRALSLMPSPLMSAVVTAWIREGTAEALLAGVRREARARRQLAAEILPAAVGSSDNIHVWMPLSKGWSPERLGQAAHARGLSLVGADTFAAGADFDNGVRISLGATAKRAALADALKAVAQVTGGDPLRPRLVV
ncbi:PLP-dependent aminotransferase family protein, partial [Phenylobacterium sp.]|uniref:aminotransferase-like domain-containing protein n=1 Tax=Phenylobacterium sp. TaxID=1871053 RepID=UPI002E346A03